jgi:hypothetical protein
MKQGDAVKLVIAIVILIAAGLLIAWNFGMFESKSTAAPSRPADSSTPPAKGAHTAPGA